MEEKNPIKKWIEILVPDFVTGVVAAFAGAKIAAADKDKEPSTAKNLGYSIGQVLALDRGEFLHELRVINARTQGGLESLIKLFDKLEKGNGLIKIGKRWYREEWITRKLLMIPPKYRSSEYPWLNDLLEQSPVQFFAKLELLNNDGWVQILRQATEITKNGLREIDNSQTVKRLNKRLRRVRNELRTEAQRGGWRIWLEF